MKVQGESIQGRIALVEMLSDHASDVAARGEALVAGANFSQGLALVATEEALEGIYKGTEEPAEGAAQSKVHIVPQSVYDYTLGTPAGFMHPGSTWLTLDAARVVIGSGLVDSGPLAGLELKLGVQVSPQQHAWKDRRAS